MDGHLARALSKGRSILPKGDCWHGGGLWTGVKKYWLNDGYGHHIVRDTSAVQRDTQWQPATNYGGECPGVYYQRLMRDGWVMKEVIQVEEWRAKVIFEKACPAGWVLRKIAHAETGAPPGKGCYWDEYELIGAAGETIACPHWEWAELDGKRLVWATEGRLETGRLTAKGLVQRAALFDFNEMAFSPIETPY